MREYSLDSYNDAMEHINAVIGSTNSSTENLSRDRLLRVQKGLHHLLTEVIPTIEDEQLRVVISYWVNCIHDITRCEECDSKRGMDTSNLTATTTSTTISLGNMSQIELIAYCADNADIYARQLRELYHSLLDAPLRRADLATAARMSTLITELNIMTDLAVDGIEKATGVKHG